MAKNPAVAAARRKMHWLAPGALAFGLVASAALADPITVSATKLQLHSENRAQTHAGSLEYITGHDDIWVTTGREIAEYFIDNYYDQTQQDIAAKQGRKN